jgi:hypothetical protein
MKKFVFVVSFVLLSQVTLAEEANNSSHADVTTKAAATSTSTAPQKPVVEDKSAKLFDYISACLAGRAIPAAETTQPVSK